MLSPSLTLPAPARAVRYGWLRQRGRPSAARPALPLNDFSWWVPAPLADQVARRLDTATNEAWMDRLWQRDATLWTDTGEAAWLGWLQPGMERARLGRMVAACRRLCVAGHTDAVLLGMGGASLGAEVLAHGLGVAAGGLRLHVLDSTCPAQVQALQASLPLAQCLFIVASKSGATLETRLLADHFHRVLIQQLGRREAGRRFIAITDPGSPLRDQARRDGYAAVFDGSLETGGRYAVLSAFGLAPLALSGHDPAEFLRDTRAMVRACGPGTPAADNPGLVLGALLGDAALAGRDKLTFICDPGLALLAGWLEQLLAESTGKQGRGIVPVVGEPISNDVGHYADDRLFVHLARADAPGAAARAQAQRLADAGFPVLRCEVAGPRSLGQEFFRWQVATAVAAAILGVNPFDQPDVETSKSRARDALQSPAEPVPEAEPTLRIDAAQAGPAAASAQADAVRRLAAFAAPLPPGAYVAVLAYIARHAAHDAHLASLRQVLHQAGGHATLGGFGPRYLHASGQLHKGGPDGGHFLFITADAAGETTAASGMTDLAALLGAQAQGDRAELASRGRRCLHVHISGPLQAGLARLEVLLQWALATPPQAPRQSCAGR